MYVEDTDLTPYLAAADLMITDHSSAGFEFLVVDRPLVVFDAPQLAAAARINPEKVELLRAAATVVRSAGELPFTVRAELDRPDRFSQARRRIASEMFFEPGTATARALDVAYELLEAEAAPSVRRAAQSSVRSVP